jgi:hypothetical protein
MIIIIAIYELKKAEIGLDTANNGDCAGKIRFR